MSKRTKSGSKKPSTIQMSDKTRNTLIVLTSAVLVIGGGVWAYYKFTTVPPPVLEKAQSDEVVEFLGNPRGLSRMPVSKRRDYLVRTYQHYSRGPQRDQFAHRIRRMSQGERRVFVDATFDIARVQFMEQAKEYNKIRNKKKRAKFVDSAINNFENLRMELGGTGPNTNLGAPFKGCLPQKSEDWMKEAMKRTSARDRAQAKPLIEDLASRAQNLRQAQAR